MIFFQSENTTTKYSHHLYLKFTIIIQCKSCTCKETHITESSKLVTSISMSSQLETELFLLWLVQLLRQLHLVPESPPMEAGRSSFLYLTLLFWNQIFTCFSDSCRQVAISIRLNLDRYMLAANSLSSSKSWVEVKAVLIRLLESLEEISWFGDFSVGWGLGVESLLLVGEVFKTGDEWPLPECFELGVKDWGDKRCCNIGGTTLGREATGRSGA